MKITIKCPSREFCQKAFFHFNFSRKANKMFNCPNQKVETMNGVKDRATCLLHFHIDK